jgi:hypothetical protein
MPSTLTTRPSSPRTRSGVPSAAGEARRRRCGPEIGEQVARRHDLSHPLSIGGVAGSEVSPASGGGGAVVARPRALEF